MLDPLKTLFYQLFNSIVTADIYPAPAQPNLTSSTQLGCDGFIKNTAQNLNEKTPVENIFVRL
jgi:hypothetical protein